MQGNREVNTHEAIVHNTGVNDALASVGNSSELSVGTNIKLQHHRRNLVTMVVVISL